VACGSFAIAVIFADASLGAVLEATRIHDEIGPSLQWWQENTRYNYLFSFISMGSFAKRLPVLLAFAMVLLVMVLRERAGTSTERQSSRAVAASGPALAFALSIGVLWLTPSKWTHHFGALIGLGTVVTVLMLADLPATLRGHRVSRLSMAAITFVFSVAVALSFAGPNAWFGYSQYGVNEYLSPRLSSPWLWILAGAAAAAIPVLVRRQRRGELKVALEQTPVAVVVLALLASIGLCVGTFANAAVKLRGTWSIAKENTDHLTSSSCGMGDYTQVLTYGKLTPTGSTEPFFGNGFTAQGAVYPPPVTPAEAGLPMWGSYVDGFGPGREWYTGEYVSPWYELPALDDRSDISVLVTGRLFDGNKVTVEYAKGDESPLGNRILRDYQSTAGWRELVAADTTLAPAGTELLRLRLNDGSVDNGGWLATTAPRLRTGGQSLTDVIGRAPVLADWPIAIAFPCLRAARLQHGLVEPPAYVLNSDFLAAQNSRDEQQGGTFVPAFQAANGGVVVPSRVEGMPGWITRWLGSWGTLTQYFYPYPADGYRLEIRHRTMSGADWSYQQPIVKPIDELREQDRQGTETTDD
jgi:arabinosyltransferase C